MFAAEEARSVKGFEFFAFAKVKSLADIDESRNRRISRAKCAGDDRTDVRRGDSLRRRIAGVPLILVAGVKDKAKVSGGIGADERSPVHYACDVFEALGEFDIIDDGIDLRESAEDLIGFDAALERGVALGVEGFGMGHAASHP